MKPFMDKDFLLETDTAKHLFHDIAADMPIIDYHCHSISGALRERSWSIWETPATTWGIP